MQSSWVFTAGKCRSRRSVNSPLYVQTSTNSFLIPIYRVTNLCLDWRLHDLNRLHGADDPVQDGHFTFLSPDRQPQQILSNIRAYSHAHRCSIWYRHLVCINIPLSPVCQRIRLACTSRGRPLHRSKSHVLRHGWSWSSHGCSYYCDSHTNGHLSSHVSDQETVLDECVCGWISVSRQAPNDVNIGN